MPSNRLKSLAMCTAVALLFSGGLDIREAASAPSCAAFEDWLEVDVFVDDHQHQVVGSPHPENQLPAGEWEFQAYVLDRGGHFHKYVTDNFTIESGEHPNCFDPS